MDDTGFAAPTAATDGRRVYALFANGDLGCFDFIGSQIWMKNLTATLCLTLAVLLGSGGMSWVLISKRGSPLPKW